ncbi:zinc transporter ZupT [Corynebacterium endometrii]|uniref:Zinc transporter ZupT n=1 Tax=Corynebacterium endometrii TaxID=2488819 RepID=A0A4P7QET6_9CORY|nr:zinc transporter ZupT [Corynebacterium endometrii]QCB28155.1 Zinc transporter ZupT [Corynebacterium endometrii]
MDYELSTVAFALGLTLFAGLSTAIGGAIAVGRRAPGPKFLAASLGLSAGVMLYVSFMEILPEAANHFGEVYDSEMRSMGAAVTAFFGGVAVIAIIDRLVPEEINPHEPSTTDEEARRRRLMKAGVFTAAALAVHNFPEGFATFVSGLEDLSIAIPIAVAIAIHNIPEGIAVAVPLREALGSRKKAFWWATLSGLAEPLGAVIGFLILMPLLGPMTMGVALAGVAGIMVFISLDELLPTAEEFGEHHSAIYGMIGGMAVMAFSLVLFM